MALDQYEKLAKNYDTRWEKFTQKSLLQVMGLLPQDLNGKNIIDIGCGTGTLILEILSRYPNAGSLHGVDISPKMLKQARNKLQGVPNSNKVVLTQQIGDIIDLPHKTFDIVICSNTFHYFNNPTVKLREFKRLLKKEGLLILEDYSKKGIFARYFEGII